MSMRLQQHAKAPEPTGESAISLHTRLSERLPTDPTYFGPAASTLFHGASRGASEEQSGSPLLAGASRGLLLPACAVQEQLRSSWRRREPRPQAAAPCLPQSLSENVSPQRLLVTKKERTPQQRRLWVLRVFNVFRVFRVSRLLGFKVFEIFRVFRIFRVCR